MKIKTKYRDLFQVYKLDADNEVKFNVEGQGDIVTSYLNIDETRKLIKFLSEQVDTYNLKTAPKIITADMIIEEFNKTWDKIGKIL